MEPAYPGDAKRMELALVNDVKPKRKKRWTPRPRLLDRDALDGRTNAAKAYDAMVREIETDLGGSSELSAIERALVRGFTGAYISVAAINMRIVQGQPVDLGELSGCVSAMVRVASRLGLQRRAREIVPSLSQYLREREKEEA